MEGIAVPDYYQRLSVRYKGIGQPKETNVNQNLDDKVHH